MIRIRTLVGDGSTMTSSSEIRGTLCLTFQRYVSGLFTHVQELRVLLNTRNEKVDSIESSS